MFKIATASIIGHYHTEILLNNQDAFKIIQEKDKIIAVVCDGCTGSKQSEIASKLTAEFVAYYCNQKFWYKKFDTEELTKAVTDFYQNIITLTLHQEPKQLIYDTFFTTIVGCMWSPKELVIFYSGDGVFVVNEDIFILEKTADNDYLGHNLLSNDNQTIKAKYFDAKSVEKILLASDGLEYLFENEEMEDIISQIFDNQHFTKNDLLKKYILDNGNHFDDTTIVALKK